MPLPEYRRRCSILRVQNRPARSKVGAWFEGLFEGKAETGKVFGIDLHDADADGESAAVEPFRLADGLVKRAWLSRQYNGAFVQAEALCSFVWIID